MKRVYLDWGVVSYLKKDEYAELRDLFLSNKDRLFFVYSPAHLEDLMKSKGEPQFDDDIKMLSDLVDDHLLDIDKGAVLPYRVRAFRGGSLLRTSFLHRHIVCWIC